MSNVLRLFVAVELPPHALEALEAVQRGLRAQLPGQVARWVRPQGTHLTLKFLGEVPAERVDDIAHGVRSAVESHAPFGLWLEGLGAFPNLEAARVLWVGVGGEVEALGRLQAAVEEHLAPLGYPPERRPFSAHLTLARAARRAGRAEREALGALVAHNQVGRLAAWQVESVSLMRSQLKPGGAVYTQLAEAALTHAG